MRVQSVRALNVGAKNMGGIKCGAQNVKNKRAEAQSVGQKYRLHNVGIQNVGGAK